MKTTKQQKPPKFGTNINYSQTLQEIQTYLVKAGARKISIDYDEAELPPALTFCYQHKGGIMFFSLPLRFNGMDKLLKQKGVVYRTGDLHPINVAWRIMKDWILAQLALIDAEMAELPEIFLPYAVANNGETLWENIKNSDQPPFKLLQS